MYKPPAIYTKLIKAINAVDETRAFGQTQVHVELVLTLIEALGLPDEPITVGWVLLAGIPLPNDRLNSLTSGQRQMLANARQIVPLASRFAWEAALRDYTRLPAAHRNYEIAAQHLEQQILDGCKRESPPHPEYFAHYQQMLTESLAFQTISQNQAAANEPYTVSISGESGNRQGRVRFTEAHIACRDQLPEKWFDQVRPRQPIHISWADLEVTAELLDKKELTLGNRMHWAADLRRINFQRVKGSGVQAQVTPSNVLDLDGFFHMAGIVSSGKTTLAILIAAYAIAHNLDLRITLVVGDTNTAIQLANRLNCWFCTDPATAMPVAVAILGQTTRSTHLGRLLVSRDYRKSQRDDTPHWGERWLNPVCPLDALVEWADDENRQIPTGSEPCQRLQKTEMVNGKQKITSHLCPLFAVCPSKQMYRDMPSAQIWITTPGALSQSSVPHQLEKRPIKIGDLVYEQSDLVIFDEAETIVDWFDHVYACNVILTNGNNGLLDRLDIQVARYLTANRTPSPEFQKWLFAERAATKAISSILTVLDASQSQGLERLRQWIKSGQFTRNSLSYRLSRRLAGLKEYELRDDLTLEQRQTEEEQTRAVLRYFEVLGKSANPFQRPPAIEDTSAEAVGARELAGIMQQMNSAGLDVGTEDLIASCRNWIVQFFQHEQAIENGQDIIARLAALREKLTISPHKADSKYLEQDLIDHGIDDLAMRLFFTLWVIVLDWHLDIVFHEWHRKPSEIDSEQPFAKIPRHLRNILPHPPTGAQFGLYRVSKPAMPSDANYLTQFVYLNIGRDYILNFH